MSWLRSQTGCRQAPRLPLLANPRNGLADPVKARRGGEVARGTPALCQRNVWVANGFFNSSSTSQAVGTVQEKALEGGTVSLEERAELSCGCFWLKRGPPLHTASSRILMVFVVPSTPTPCSPCLCAYPWPQTPILGGSHHSLDHCERED